MQNDNTSKPANSSEKTADTAVGKPADTAVPTTGAMPTGTANTKADADGKTKKDDAQTKKENGEPAVRVVIRQCETEDEMPLTKNVTLGKILGGDILNAQIIRKQIWVIVLAAMFIIVYISNRYKCQQDLILIDKLTKELKDAKYRALSSSSELTQQTRESKVLEQLRNDKDSTLHISAQPPYIINVPNTENQ